MILYKYLAIEGALKSLEHNTLRATRPLWLNDPFECKNRLILDGIEKELIDKIRNNQTLRGYFNKIKRGLMDADGISNPIRDVEKTYHARALEACVKVYKKSQQDKLDMKNHEHITLLSERFACICLTQNNNHNLMWSHYAEAHEGALIEIETDDFDATKNLIKIRYKKKPPEATLATLKKTVDSFIGVKSKEWDYEKEYRIHCQTHTDLLNHSILPNGEELLTLTIPEKSIKRVVLGARINAETQAKIESILKEDRYSHIDIEYAHIAPDSYSLIYSKTDEGLTEMLIKNFQSND